MREKTEIRYGLLTLSTLVLLALIFVSNTPVAAQSVEDCMMCHEDNELVRESTGESVYVDLDRFTKSVHTDLDCISCHTDLDGFDDFPHDENLADVNCGDCHDDIAEIYNESLHGKDVAAGIELAPRCWDCHSGHYVLPKNTVGSQVDKFNIPFMCGRCHKEGTPVTQTYDIPQDSILSHYSLSIHGIGLFQQGLTVTAVCSDCHTAHNVRNHSDPKSSIHRNNIAKTCQNCHGRIEQVHKKVIQGELWEKEPNKVPVCVDCHQPHTIRKVFYGEVSNKECLACHSKPDISMERNGEKISLYVDSIEVHNSIHHSVTCAQCHTGASPHLSRPCSTVPDKVDCSICHSATVVTYATSTHGKLADRGDPNAPLCEDCHGTHGIRGRQDPGSPTYPINVPNLCAKCHAKGMPAAVRHQVADSLNRVESYEMSIHGKGLIESGLVVTAMCTDCHTAHHVLPLDDPESSVNHNNVAQTCARCHNGIYEKFQKSIHSATVTDTDKPLPSCNNCHQSHAISRTDTEGFKELITRQCGSCHEDVTESYFDTYHGKVSRLGYQEAARCYNCHGAHDILPPDNINSHLSRQNIVATCGQCHEGSHRQFAGYLTHATHHDRNKYPILFYTFWFMTTLLVGTLIVAGIHTLLWLPRSFQAMREHKKLRKQYHGHLEYRRFKRLHSIQHVMVIISFLGLAVTGMVLKFSYLGWAQWISDFLGGFDSTGFVHRVCAVITFAYFGIHIFDVIHTKRKNNVTWRQMLFDKDSMLPNMTDLRELIASLKWFLHLGPRPDYGRWTYWEKFDYFAVFWGVAIIGSTGLILWFSEFFTLFLPGWIVNVATIIHSDEALLATAFIFTVHFFNTHFRPDKFPMDTVIFTGRVPLEELKLDRPREYQELLESKKLKKQLVEPLPPVLIKVARVFGTAALITGLILILLIIYAVIFGYR
ncbi:MAG: cytochrome c3 family protein [Candidatus Zixiibacteriota bacterium]